MGSYHERKSARVWLTGRVVPERENLGPDSAFAVNCYLNLSLQMTLPRGPFDMEPAPLKGPHTLSCVTCASELDTYS